ncbi:Zn-ribbon domain-containing OB-fold protein [Chloroflexota bacterium]
MAERKYIYTIDPFPQQYEDTTRLYQFYDYLREGRLTTTRCKSCGHIPWPPRVVCPKCLSDDLEWVDMPKTGKVSSYTIQVAAVPPGYEPPLIFALVDFDNGVRMLTTIVDIKPEEAKIGLEVELKVEQVAPDHADRERVIPHFTVKR